MNDFNWDRVELELTHTTDNRAKANNAVGDKNQSLGKSQGNSQDLPENQPTIRTYAAKEAVRLAREKVRRNDMIVTQLMHRSELRNFDSGPTEEIVHNSPGDLARPGESHGNYRANSLDTNREATEKESDENVEVREDEIYRIRTTSTIFSFFRDLFD